ncbi:MAG: ligase-associated DNA damage response endonuclease PdeM [Wenzhouxiangella sp.]
MDNRSPILPGSLAIQLAGQAMHLLPDRAVFWPAQNALLLADVHLGKDTVFRRQGLAVPAGVLEKDLARLDALLSQTRADRLMVLGDWVHAPPLGDEHWPEQIEAWRARHGKLAIDLVLGNHDRQLSCWLERWQITPHAGALELEGLRLVHEPDDARGKPGLSGHLHPGIRLRQRRDSLRLPAFLLGGEHLVLPAFGRFTGLMDSVEFPTRRAFVTSGQQVHEIPLGRS